MVASVKTMNTTNRRPDIQGLRAVAVTMVVAYHAGLPIPGGFLGVDVFFVISGFVICRMLAREWENTGRLDFARFYWRRFKRLTPALALIVAVTLLAGCLLLSPLGPVAGASAQTGIGAMLLAANVAIAKTTGGYFDAAAETNPLLHTWSLSVEEQFYLVFPLLLMVGLRFSRIWKPAPVFIIIGVSAASFCLALTPLLRQHMSDFNAGLLGFYSPVPRIWEFGAGAIIALLAQPSVPNNRYRAFASLAGAVGLVVSVFVIDGSLSHPGIVTLAPVLFTVLLIWGGSVSNPITQLLSSRPLVWLGDVSYSWYLWHWPAIVLVPLAMGYESSGLLLIAAMASLIPAAASYYWVEQPIRHGAFTAKRATGLIGVSFSAPITAGLFVLALGSVGYFSTSIQTFRKDVDTLHIAREARCSEGMADAYATDRCVWNASATGQPVYLVGDSNADHLAEGLIGAVAAQGRSVRVAAKAGCAFLGRSWADRNDTDQEACLGYVDGVRDFLVNRAPVGTIVVGMSDSLWTSYDIAVGVERASETTDRREVLRYLQQELEEFVLSVQAAGHQVVLVQPVPKFVRDGKVMFDFTTCSAISIALWNCEALFSSKMLAEERERQEPARTTIGLVSAETGALLVDLGDILCPGGLCRIVSSHGRIMYRDAGHLSIPGSEQLVPAFLSAMPLP